MVADCVVAILTKKETPEGPGRDREMDIEDVAGADHALGVQELRALNVLAKAGLVAPLRYRPAPVSELTSAIVALCSRARAVIGETRTTLSEALETAKCFHYGLIPVTPPDLTTGHSLSAGSRRGERTLVFFSRRSVSGTCVRRYRASNPG